MAELDERIITVEAAITCCTPFGMEPLPTWFVDTVREMMARDAERGVQISKLEAENAELREQAESASKDIITWRASAMAWHKRAVGLKQEVNRLEAENAELRKQLRAVALKASELRCCAAQERNERLQERLDRLEGRLRGRFHDDMACGACGGPLDACRDAICCQCSPEPEVLVAMARLRRAEGILVERDRQDAKWGADQGKTPWEWLAVIMEEVGELAQVLLRRKFGRDEVPEEWWEEAWRLEATQVAASALAMMEQTQGKGASDGGD